MNSLDIPEPLLVTGATGFIGRRLVQRLMEAGASPRALVLPDDAVPPSWGERVDVRLGDVSDRVAVARTCSGVRTVIHLAAMVGDWGGEALHRRVTVGGTENVLAEAALGRARVVLASSVVVYGDRLDRVICDESTPFGRPLGPYSRAKQSQERIARRLERERGLLVAIVRPGNVYGAGSIPWVDVAVAQLERGMPALVGGGIHNACLCHVENAAGAFLLAASRPAAVGRAYNVNDASDVTWHRYFTDLARLAGTRPPRAVPRLPVEIAAHLSEFAWRLLGRNDRPPVTRESLNLVASNARVPIARIRRELGFEPRFDYADGLAEIAAYLGRRATS